MRFEILSRLGSFILSDDETWVATKEKARYQNSWFTDEFLNLAINNIATQFLDKNILKTFAENYQLPTTINNPKTVGVIMAGNIPLVGFHDFLSVFLSGNKIRIKASSKDDVLLKHMVNKMIEWEPAISDYVAFEEMLKGCDAYIATGSNNSSRYFDYYFSKYPNIIRRNRTSVAVLDGKETVEELQSLADDVFLFFGLGCRNVTKIYVPADYEFIPLIEAFKKYNYLGEHNKFKNNYDYNLAIHILNNKFYMSTDAIILLEDKSCFSPISQLNYEFYTDKNEVTKELKTSSDIQCVMGHDFIPFGKAQCPSISDFADGIDTMEFLRSL